MRLRSLLFVPGDRADRIEKAIGTAADALILDLEDSVAASAKAAARRIVAEFLQIDLGRRKTMFVRVSPIDSEHFEADLAAVISHRYWPDGIVLPKAEGAETLRALDSRIDRAMAAIAHPEADEAARELYARVPLILPIATETPKAMFALGSYGGVTRRLAGLTWGAEDLPAAIGAATSREEDGRYTAPYELARSLCLFGAAAAGVQPIETVYPGFKDLDGLAAYAARARRDGFIGMMAIHPAQIETINAAFTPSESELAHARAVVAAFAADPGAGALQLDGRMIDRPHLVQAERLLAQAGD